MRHHILLVLIFTLSFPVLAQTTPVDELVRREMHERRIPGLQLAVVQRGKIILLKSYGTADLQHNVPVTNRSVFPINSCTKAFTGVAIMQLVEEGKIDLSAPVSRYLHDLPAAWQPVTVRQLLTHVSGLPNVLQVLDPRTYGFSAGMNEESVWAKTKSLPVSFATGERFSYNQTNYALLGKIIDAVITSGTSSTLKPIQSSEADKPFVHFFQRRQFRVAGMLSTGFGDSRDVVPHMVQTYRYVSNIDGQQLNTDRLLTNYAEFPAFRRTAAGMNSTAEDLAHWIIALQHGKLLRTKSALDTLWTPGTYNNGEPTLWALGWMTKPLAQHRTVKASGGGRAAFFVYPDDDLAIIVLTNLAGAFPEEFIDELAGLYHADISASDPITALRMILRKRGYEHAIAAFDELKRKNPKLVASETELNDWAYRMMNGGGKPKEALEIFKLNVHLYPNSANVYDSVAEAYEKNGFRDLAIKNYQRSLELDPQNTNAIQQLKRLERP